MEESFLGQNKKTEKEVIYKKASLLDIPTLISVEKSIVDSKTYSAMLEENEWFKAIEYGLVYISVA
jgi:hypothetical protein